MLQLCCSVAALVSKGEWSGLEGGGGVRGHGVCVPGLSENGRGSGLEGEQTNCVKEG